MKEMVLLLKRMKNLLLQSDDLRGREEDQTIMDPAWINSSNAVSDEPTTVSDALSQH